MRDKCWFKFDKVKARVFLAFLWKKKKPLNSGCGHICDPSTEKTEAGRSRAQTQHGLYKETIQENRDRMW